MRVYHHVQDDWWTGVTAWIDDFAAATFDDRAIDPLHESMLFVCAATGLKFSLAKCQTKTREYLRTLTYLGMLFSTTGDNVTISKEASIFA